MLHKEKNKVLFYTQTYKTIKFNKKPLELTNTIFLVRIRTTKVIKTLQKYFLKINIRKKNY